MPASTDARPLRPPLLEHQLFQRQALAPAFHRKLRLGIKLVDIADAEPGDDLDMLGNGERLPDIAGTVPEEYLLGDKALYILAAGKSKPSYSLTGIIDPAGMRSTNDMLTRFDEELRGTHVDLATTFDDRFVRKAAGDIK